MAIPTVPKAMKRSSPNLFGAHRYTISDGMCALRGPLHGALSARGQPNGAPTVPRPVQRTHLPLRMLRPHNSHVSHGCYSDCFLSTVIPLKPHDNSLKSSWDIPANSRTLL